MLLSVRRLSDIRQYLANLLEITPSGLRLATFSEFSLLPPTLPL